MKTPSVNRRRFNNGDRLFVALVVGVIWAMLAMPIREITHIPNGLYYLSIPVLGILGGLWAFFSAESISSDALRLVRRFVAWLEQ